MIRNIKAFVRNFAFCFQLLYKSDKKGILFLLAAKVVVAICPFMNMYIMKSIIDRLAFVLSDGLGQGSALKEMMSLLCMFTAVKVTLEFLENYIMKLNDLQMQSLLSYINVQIMNKSLQIDISYFDMPKNFDELNQSRQNAHSMHQMLFMTANTISAVLFFATNMVLALRISWWISLLVIIVILPRYLLKWKIEKKNYDFEKSQQRDARFVGYVNSLIFDRTAAKEIRLFGIGDYMIDKYVASHHKVTTERDRYSNRRSLKEIVLNLPSAALQILIKIYAAYKVLIRESTIGSFTYVTGIYENLDSGFSSLIDLAAALAGYNERIDDFKKYFMFRESAVQSGDLPVEEIKEIEFRDVSFGYPDSEIVLDRVSFTIGVHEKVMLVGLNGSGKTTLIKLLTRFYDPLRGNILINGIDISRYDIEQLRKKIAVVFQDFNVFSFTIRENVAIGDWDRLGDDGAVRSSLDFSNFNNGEYLATGDIDLYVNRNFQSDGIELSGGQRQKLAISRAVIRKSQMIILDEPTASLDPLSESEILDAFNSLYKDKTLIMVSHRLSAAVKMDKIIFMDGGRASGIGSHKELYSENEKYRKLFNLQADKYN